ncbi:hypothetical protein FHL15_007259 [Xylaria flabelliformis]|uniref:Uncharacterized protein n=1 Tax=Xylaria flabelliformis TaxID=2512241 RepID=A0A553HVF4_9PEZI|nr:hypothetical protein FHL15_007259 [Xylaria flabelliformis]
MRPESAGAANKDIAHIWTKSKAVVATTWDYCPEVKMTLAMDAAKYVPGDCGANWKRDGKSVVDSGSVGIEDLGYGTEVIDGIMYPKLPPNLVPW